MVRIKFLTVALSSAVLLGACGGGDDAAADATAPLDTQDPAPVVAAAPTAEKLAGTWSACTKTGAATSSKEIYESERLSDVDLAVSYRLENYTTADCSGTWTGGYDLDGTAKMQGSKTVEGLPTAKLVLDMPNFSTFGSVSLNGLPTGTWKHVVAIQDDALRLGDLDEKLDSEGYPEHLLAVSFTKQ